MAVTSTRGWIRRLGRRWATLHKGIYVAATLGVVHFYWLVKADTRLPVMLGAVLLVLLALRAPGLASGGPTRREPRPGRASLSGSSAP
jgi:sulfoxide reductase heme-binding subunit YedZ